MSEEIKLSSKLVEALTNQPNIIVGTGRGLKPDGTVFVSDGNKTGVEAIVSDGATTGEIIAFKVGDVWYAKGNINQVEYQNIKLRRASPNEKKFYSIIKNIVGGSYSEKEYVPIVTLRKQLSLKFTRKQNLKDEYLRLFSRFKLPSLPRFKPNTESWKIEDKQPENPKFYSSLIAQEDLSKYTRNNKFPEKNCLAYLLSCKPRTIHKFVSRKNTVQNLSFLFDNPVKDYKRISCQIIEKELKVVVGDCKNSVIWRLIEVGSHNASSDGSNGVLYASGYVTEEGILDLSEAYISNDIFNPVTKKFASTYDYPGYMQVQIGCSQVGGGLFFK